MITKIVMKNVASYKKEATFETDKKINLVYGLNGTGKSTFSNYLYDRHDLLCANCSIEGLQDTDSLLVYNQKFVNDNFYETEDIHGIFTLSKGNARAKKAIDDANAEIKKLRDDKGKIDSEIQKVENNYKKSVDKHQNETWKIKSTYSAGDRVLEFCLAGLKGNKETLFRHLVQQNVQGEIGYTVEDLKNEANSLQGNVQKQDLIPKIEFDVSDIETSDSLSKVIVGNKNSSVAELITNLENSDWVREGLQYVHMKGDKSPCPFCQQETISKKLLSQIQGYFDETYERDKKKIESLRIKYENVMDTGVNQIKMLEDNSFLTNDIQKIKVCLSSISTIKNANVNKLSEKEKNPSTVISLEPISVYLQEINQIVENANTQVQAFNDKIDHIQDALANIKDKFWKLMRKEYDSVINLYIAAEKSHVNSVDDFKKRTSENEKKQKEQQEIVTENQKNTLNIDEAVENIKSGLVDIGITDSEEHALYRLKREDSADENVFKSLSEGEKMVISFLYFMELCKGSISADSTGNNKIIVIDDPISSLSHIYIFNIGRLIHNEFLRTQKYDQIFVLTHSLYFFYELTNLKAEEREKNQMLYRISKNSEGSYFQVMKYEEIQNDYQAYWRIIRDKDSSPALIANCMRNIMEYFFNFVEKQDFNNVFQKKELQVTKFGAFNRYMNRESHSKGQNIFDIKEFDYDCFKEAFEQVFKLTGYEEHYIKMLKQ